MQLLKRTYTLPAKTVKVFEQEVAPSERDEVVAALLRSWLSRQDRQRLRREIIEGCREMAEIYLQTEREFHPLEEEVARAFDVQSETRRRGSRATRSRRGV
jgi:hypothetical protein